MKNKELEIHFEGYYDALTNKYKNNPCVWIIKNWTDAKSRLSSEESYTDFEQYLGIVSMVLSAEINKNKLELTVNTINNNYVDLWFDNPQLQFK